MIITKILKLEIKLGETNEEKENLEFAEILVQKNYNGLQKMNVNSSGDCHMSIDDLDSIAFYKQRENKN